jgi:DNA-binding transcriptional regulator YiaG
VIKQRPEHVTAASVAKEVGVSVRTIRRWEQGESEPSVGQWMTYILACDVAPSHAFMAELSLAYDDWDEKHLDG